MQCATLAYNDPPNNPINYYSFNLYYSISDATWFCLQYYDLSTAADFNTVDANVGQSYGYDATSYL